MYRNTAVPHRQRFWTARQMLAQPPLEKCCLLTYRIETPRGIAFKKRRTKHLNKSSYKSPEHLQSDKVA